MAARARICFSDPKIWIFGPKSQFSSPRSQRAGPSCNRRLIKYSHLVLLTRSAVKFEQVTSTNMYATLICLKEGSWVDYSTKQAPFTPIPWQHISEPTGFTGACHLYWGKGVTTIYNYIAAENCSGFSHGDVRAKSYDLDCRGKQSVVCQVLDYI